MPARRVLDGVRWIRAGLAATAVVLTSGCSTGVAGTPVAELWDPCTIPSETIAAAGVDPTIIDSGQLRQQDNEWLYCSFRQDWFVVTVSSTTNSVSEFRADVRSLNVRDTDAVGRPALTFQQLVGTSDEACHVAFTSGDGAIDFAVRKSGDQATVGNYCAEAVRITRALESATPS